MENVEDLQTELMQLLDSIGKYTVEEKKDSLHIVRDRAFLGVHPKKSYLGINVVLNRINASPTADKVERVSANRYHHFYKITEKRQLNKSFAKLLSEAYNLAEPKK